MDFDQFNTKEGAETGRFLHLRHLKTDELLYEKTRKGREPVGITMRGIESETVMKAINDARRAKMNGADVDEDMATAQAMVISFHHISRNDKPLTTSRDDLEWFFGLSSKLVKAAIDFSGDPGNFLPATPLD